MIDRNLTSKMYYAAVDKCDQQEAWLFEINFTEQVLKEVKSVIADCYWNRPPGDSAAYMLWVESEIDKHFYGDGNGKK